MHGISSATFYTWKAKYGGLEVLEAKRLKALEDENAKLKPVAGGRHARQRGAQEPSGKNSDARRQARGCRSSPGNLRDKRAQGVPPDEGRPQDGAVSIAPASGRGSAQPPAGAGGRASRFGYRRARGAGQGSECPGLLFVGSSSPHFALAKYRRRFWRDLF